MTPRPVVVKLGDAGSDILKLHTAGPWVRAELARCVRILSDVGHLIPASVAGSAGTDLSSKVGVNYWFQGAFVTLLYLVTARNACVSVFGLTPSSDLDPDPASPNTLPVVESWISSSGSILSLRVKRMASCSGGYEMGLPLFGLFKTDAGEFLAVTLTWSATDTPAGTFACSTTAIDSDAGDLDGFAQASFGKCEHLQVFSGESMGSFLLCAAFDDYVGASQQLTYLIDHDFVLCAPPSAGFVARDGDLRAGFTAALKKTGDFGWIDDEYRPASMTDGRFKDLYDFDNPITRRVGADLQPFAFFFSTIQPAPKTTQRSCTH